MNFFQRKYKDYIKSEVICLNFNLSWSSNHVFLSLDISSSHLPFSLCHAYFFPGVCMLSIDMLTKIVLLLQGTWTPSEPSQRNMVMWWTGTKLWLARPLVEHLWLPMLLLCSASRADATSCSLTTISCKNDTLESCLDFLWFLRENIDRIWYLGPTFALH